MEGILVKSPRSVNKGFDGSSSKIKATSSQKQVRIKQDPTIGSGKHIALNMNSLQHIPTMSDDNKIE